VPAIEASVSTLVVSWNDAAEMKLSVLREALVIPRINGSAVAGLPPAGHHGLIGVVETDTIDLLFDDEIGVADIDDLNAPHHLAHDHLDMLVVDAHPLQPVNLLNFIHQVARQGHFALDPQDVLGDGRATDQGLAGFDIIAFVNIDMLAARDQVLFFVADIHRA
jgi:hypothetical protein